MSLLDALSDAFGGFFLSAAQDEQRWRSRHPDRATYAPPIVHRHEPWPGGRPAGGERPYQPWPGGEHR